MPTAKTKRKKAPKPRPKKSKRQTRANHELTQQVSFERFRRDMGL